MKRFLFVFICCAGALLLVLKIIPFMSSIGKIRFKEQVQLSSGDIIEISREFRTKSLGEIGGPGGWDAAFNTFTVTQPIRPDNPPVWQSEAGFIPLLLDRDLTTGEWLLVVTFYTCEAWRRLGSPKLPYAEFRVHAGEWQQIELSPKLIGREANVLTTIRSDEGNYLHTLEVKRERNSDPRIDQMYLKILTSWGNTCE